MTMMNATCIAVHAAMPPQPSVDPRIGLFLKRHLTVQWANANANDGSNTNYSSDSEQATDELLMVDEAKARQEFQQVALSRRTIQQADKAEVHWRCCQAYLASLQAEINASNTTTTTNLWTCSQSLQTLKKLLLSGETNIFEANDFLLLSQLGEGTFGKVYKAVHIPTGHIVALKEIDIESSAIERNEQHLLPLDCGVVPCYGTFLAAASGQDVLANNGQQLKTWMILKYCPNGSLKDRLQDNGILSQKEAAYIIKRVAKIVAYLYEKHGIVHNDIKPDNVLFVDDDDNEDGHGSVLLCDLGCATRGQWQTERLGGTYSHMSPEKLAARKLNKGKFHCDEKVDVWALGVMLCEMIFMVHPFMNDPLVKCPTITPDGAPSKFDPADRIYQLTTKCYDAMRLPNTPIGTHLEAKDLLRKLLALDPLDRMSLASIRKHPFIKKNGKWSDRTLFKLRTGLGLHKLKRRNSGPKEADTSSQTASTRGDNSSRRGSLFLFEEEEEEEEVVDAIIVNIC